MAVLMVFVVYLTITGYISGQENEGKGLQAALRNIVKDDIQNPADLDKDEKLLETKPQGLDENMKLFDEDKSASDLSSNPKIDSSQKDNSEGGQKNEAGIFKPIGQKSHSNGIKIKHNPDKPAVHKVNDEVSPKKHSVAKKTLSKAVAKTADKNDGILPNGGKMIHAKLPDSLLLKQVPKPLGQFAQLKTGKIHGKRPRRKVKTNKNKSKKGRVHMKKGGGHGKKGRGHGKKVGVHAKNQAKVSKKSRKLITKKKMPHKA